MEFYSDFLDNDEIRKEVSIPNGMEFYFNPNIFKLRFKRFNSQRDGILRWANRGGSEFRRVSIPNGMEFYAKSFSLFFLYEKIVSIPNGMEFYLSLEFAIGITALFQFPTGWNSTPFSRMTKWSISVSIPNGMEFYDILIDFV